VKFRFKELVNYFILFTSIFIIDVNLCAQSTKDLDKQKRDNIQQLSLSKELLEKTGKSKNLTLNQLNLIQQNIELRLDIIDNISNEIIFLKNDIDANNKEISEIEVKISDLKKEYVRLVIVAARNLDEDYALLYIYSSQDFNQAYQRIKYLKYLAKFRNDVADNLKNEEFNFKKENLNLLTNKKKNEVLLVERKRELISLGEDRKLNLSLIKSLQVREIELKEEIKKRERIQDEIEKEIRRIIEEEAEKARAAKKANILSEEDKILSTDFSKNFGKLPWPSEKYIITGKFGEHNHPVLRGIKVKSNGIDINTNEGEKVRSVFEGEVTKVFAILGANYTVIIKHGDFRTVYQNLVDVKVKAGDKIKTKGIIGTVYTDEDKVSKFHFEIWKNKVTQNPEIWLRR
jgi:murein hydrolase activator